MPLTNRHILITGGTGALGTAVVARLLDSGAICHVPWLEEKELKHFPFVDPEASQNRVHLYGNINLTDETQVVDLYAAAALKASSEPTRGARLWASIHIAGGFAYGPIESVSKDAFVHQMQTNALSCFLCCREAVKHLSAGHPAPSVWTGGRIVNVAARPALEPRTGANMVPYTAAKSAVAAITQSLAEEVAPRNILVNAVLPSIMDTPANRASMPKADFAKWPKVDDVASTIVFLASPENTVTRGGLVPVYGGA